MVVMTDVTVVLGVAVSLSADVRKHLKEFCPLISGLSGTIQGNEGKEKLPWLPWRQAKIKSLLTESQQHHSYIVFKHYVSSCKL